jgi:hypothetical protein
LIKQHIGLITFGRTKRTPLGTDNALEKIRNALEHKDKPAIDSFDEEEEQHATSPAATNKQLPISNPFENLQQYGSTRRLATHLKGANNLDHIHIHNP